MKGYVASWLVAAYRAIALQVPAIRYIVRLVPRRIRTGLVDRASNHRGLETQTRLETKKISTVRGKSFMAEAKQNAATKAKLRSESLPAALASECAICRARDSVLEERRTSAILVDLCEKLGVDLYRLPSADGIRYAVAQSATSSFCKQLASVCSENEVAIEHVTVEVSNNAYEFDQVQFVSPSRAEVLLLFPKSHCRSGEAYLKERALRLELIESRRDALVIPMPKLGPRIIGRDRADAFKVREPLGQTIGDWPFPIDLVYAWVDTNDDIWREKFRQAAHELEQCHPLTAATNAGRWYSRDELLYSLRSVEMYAPFVRNIYIVTNGQRPKWLQDHERVKVVTHEELYPNPSVLPTFNSNHIETVLHRIPGLAEHFLYLNDDFFFARRCTPEDFFTIGGVGKVFFSNRYLDDRPVSEYDRATVASHKNTRDLLFAKFGVHCHRKFKHAPYVMRRSVWNEIEREFGEELEATRRNRFRSRQDLNGQFLYAHYALLVGAACPADIKDRYVDVQDRDFIAKLRRAEAAGAKVFCINDANSDEDNVSDPDVLVRGFLEQRFPIRAPWEVGDYESIRPASFWAKEVRLLGAQEAERKYATLMLTGNGDGARRLYRLYYNQGRHLEAAKVASEAPWSPREKVAKQIDALSKELRARDILSLVPELPLSDRKKALSQIVRGIDSVEDYEMFRRVAEECCTDESERLQVLAAAARRAGLPGEGVRYLERALAITPIAEGNIVDKRRESQRMAAPRAVLKDLLEVAGSDKKALFLDAGTLLGCIRDGKFIEHDYDIDLSTRDRDAFERLASKLKKDWRFNVSRVRRPDLLIQARHVNGTYVDVFLHVRDGRHWIKRSHVYGWRFEDYQLETRKFEGIEVNVPVPAERYLEQMYGSDWRIPIPGFDSRLFAPNCFFPDQDELICTLLNKAVDGVRAGDRVAVERCRSLLKELVGYDMSLPIDPRDDSGVAESACAGLISA